MEIAMNVWLSFNIVFGLWSLRNWIGWVCALMSGKQVNQNTLGVMMDLVIPASILAYIMTVYS